MDTPAERQRSERNRRCSRRRFVAGSAGVAATTLLPGAVRAQTDGAEPVLTDAAISATVPTLDRDDYTGLFVQVVAVESTAELDIGADACGFLDADEELLAYETRLIDRIGGDRQSTSAVLYASAGNEEIHEGKLFVVNSQAACSADFVGLTLERIGAGRIGDGSADGTPGSTDSRTPGFGVHAALTGLGTASLVALRRTLDD